MQAPLVGVGVNDLSIYSERKRVYRRNPPGGRVGAYATGRALSGPESPTLPEGEWLTQEVSASNYIDKSLVTSATFARLSTDRRHRIDSRLSNRVVVFDR